MLSEVKKEVDVMVPIYPVSARPISLTHLQQRLLKGHPNIVHLIDAAWHRMQNGLYEVFILMEFCPGV
jgi:AP2-associated kinase